MEDLVTISNTCFNACSKMATNGRFYKRFLMWRERHWATYMFADGNSRCRPTFSFPPSYSVCVQSHHDSDDNSTGWSVGDGALADGQEGDVAILDRTWHFPVNRESGEKEG